MGKLYDKICNKLDEWDERINTYTINKKYKYVMRVHELGDYGIDTPQFDLWGRFMAVGTYGDCRLYCKLADKGLSFALMRYMMNLSNRIPNWLEQISY